MTSVTATRIKQDEITQWYEEVAAWLTTIPEGARTADIQRQFAIDQKTVGRREWATM